MPDINSVTMTNYSASPRVKTDTIRNGIVKSAYDTVTAPVTTTIIGDVLSFVLVPSNAAPRNLAVWANSAHTGGAMNIGLYRTPDDGGAAVDVDLFATALVTASGLSGANQLFEAGLDFEDLGTPLWELAGLSADPGCLFVVAATLTSAVATANMVAGVELTYVVTN